MPRRKRDNLEFFDTDGEDTTVVKSKYLVTKNFRARYFTGALEESKRSQSRWKNRLLAPPRHAIQAG